MRMCRSSSSSATSTVKKSSKVSHYISPFYDFSPPRHEEVHKNTENGGDEDETEGLNIDVLLKENKTWEEVGFLNKMRLFNLWMVLSLVGSIVQLIGCVIALLDTYITTDLGIFAYKESIIGFGSMFAWIIMLNYLKYNKNVNLMTATLQKSSTNIFMFLLGVMPFFFGFVFLGQCIFWKYSKFENTTTTIISLFSMANGDIVNETFQDTWAEGVLG